jgi:signal transduction histidine kinase
LAGRTAYRVVREALTNARKHAAGQPVRLVLAGKPGETLVIDTYNLLPSVGSWLPNRSGNGAGLVGLTERVQLAGGRLEHEVNQADEFHLHAWLPWPR